jgi:hypothetical protein
MKFHANSVSAAFAGDCYQALFEETVDEAGLGCPYLLIQRDFETPDDGAYYLETHNEEFRGHFFLRRIEFSQSGVSVEIDRPNNNRIDVTFSMSNDEYEEAEPIMNIISGEMDPFDE